MGGGQEMFYFLGGGVGCMHLIFDVRDIQITNFCIVRFI